MALTVVDLPAYASVPALSGVPTLIRAASAVAAATALQSADTYDQSSLAYGPQWGIFTQDGSAVLIGDAVAAVGVRREQAISDYPVEQGGFASYNKVAVPFDARVMLTKGGSVEEREAFLSKLESMVTSLDLYSVVMPEFVFPSANVVRYDFERRAQNGATMLTVSVVVREVRTTATSAFTQSTSQSASGASTQNGGTVQATDPTAAQSAAASAATVN